MVRVFGGYVPPLNSPISMMLDEYLIGILDVPVLLVLLSPPLLERLEDIDDQVKSLKR